MKPMGIMKMRIVGVERVESEISWREDRGGLTGEKTRVHLTLPREPTPGEKLSVAAVARIRRSRVINTRRVLDPEIARPMTDQYHGAGAGTKELWRHVGQGGNYCGVDALVAFVTLTLCRSVSLLEEMAVF